MIGPPRARRVALGLLAALVAASCSIQPDTSPREIPQGDRPPFDLVSPEGGEAAGTTRVYLVADDGDGEHLRAVQRNVDATPDDALAELFKGENDQEEDAGLGSAIPDGLRLLGARPVAGTLQVDVSSEILDLQVPALVLAVAQIVFTGSALDGVREVRLKVDGENREWPDGRGELHTGTLSVYDYPGLAETSQPPYPPIPSGTVPA